MDETVNKVIEALEPVAQKIGEAGSFLFQVAVRQAVMEGVVNLVLTLVFTAVAVSFALAGRREWKNADSMDSEYHANDQRFFGVVLITVGTAFLAFALHLLRYAVLYLGNPKFRGLELLVEQVK